VEKKLPFKTHSPYGSKGISKENVPDKVEIGERKKTTEMQGIVI